VQLALLISKIARFDYPREWYVLFHLLNPGVSLFVNLILICVFESHVRVMEHIFIFNIQIFVFGYAILVWICFSCCKLLGSKWLIPLLFHARMLSEFGTCKVGGRQELFPTLLQKLQSPDVLMTQRVYLVLNQILKELSTKRLAADQRNFAEVYMLGFICNLANIEHRALSGQGQEEINGIVLVCSLLAGRSLRDLRCS